MATRFEFITDFLGGGEMGDWVGPGAWNTPDPDEYVRIRGDQLQPRDGRYELRVTNELEEAMFLDRVRLLAIDHPDDVDVFPNEGLKEAPRPAFKLYATRGAHVPRRAVDDQGRDVRPLIAERRSSLARRFRDAADPRICRAAYADARSRRRCGSGGAVADWMDRLCVFHRQRRGLAGEDGHAAAVAAGS